MTFTVPRLYWIAPAFCKIPAATLTLARLVPRVLAKNSCVKGNVGNQLCPGSSVASVRGAAQFRGTDCKRRFAPFAVIGSERSGLPKAKISSRMQEFSQCVAFNLKAFHGGLADQLVKARALVGRQRLSCKSFFCYYADL
jgi:hypothetical protein